MTSHQSIALTHRCQEGRDFSLTGLATLSVPFLCSLPEEPLQITWSSRPEAVGLFPQEVLNRIEFLTAHNRTSPLATEIQKVILVQFRCSLYKIISPKLFDKQEFRTYFQRRGRDSNSWYGKPVRQFSKLVVSATHPPLRKCIPSRDSLTDSPNRNAKIKRIFGINKFCSESVRFLFFSHACGIGLT